VGVVLFAVIALALMASARSGPLAAAEGHSDSPASQAHFGPPPEPVLGGVGIPAAGPVDPASDPGADAPDPGSEPTGDQTTPDPDQLPSVEPAPEPDTDSPAPEDGTVEAPTTEPPTDTPPVEEPTGPPVEAPAPVETPPVDERPPPIGGGNATGDGSTQTPGDVTPGTGNPGGGTVTPVPSQVQPVETSISEPATGGGGSGSRGPIRFVRAGGASVGGGAGGTFANAVAGLNPAPAAAAGGFTPVGAAEGGKDGGVGSDRIADRSNTDRTDSVVRTVKDIVEVVPDSLKVALAALAALSVLLGAGYFFSTMRARRLARQRRELLQEVGLLQTALLPPVPERLGALRTSVAYRPADGPGAGGDFYDALPLPGGRVGFILGDVSGHGRGALARTAFMRYTLRAYLEAGLEPRVALQVAGRVIDENLGGDFATVLLVVHDPETGSLTYATAGHPAPIVVGPHPHDPVTASSSPPIGIGERTGLRQTTVPLVPGSVACLFTDGLIEARTADGVLGRERLTELLEELGPSTSAQALIDRAAQEARVSADDIAAVVISPTAGVTAGLFRTEQLELSSRELEGTIARRFLESCGLPEDEVAAAVADARTVADRFGGVVLHVVFGNRRRVEVLPRNVESIESASRRAASR
jgi:hypothetical protein